MQNLVVGLQSHKNIYTFELVSHFKNMEIETYTKLFTAKQKRQNLQDKCVHLHLNTHTSKGWWLPRLAALLMQKPWEFGVSQHHIRATWEGAQRVAGACATVRAGSESYTVAITQIP